MDWFGWLDRKTQAIVDARFDRICCDKHFGFVRHFDGLVELKWASGLRVYAFVPDPRTIVILNGGNKNGQDQDIKKAKSVRERFLRGSYGFFQ
jgi:putative addiction module killer protein